VGASPEGGSRPPHKRREGTAGQRPPDFLEREASTGRTSQVSGVPEPSVFGARHWETLGTFQDNKRAPIHRWFQYPAGFSFRAVEFVLDTFHIGPHDRVFDPFAGTGTTLVTCKGRGIPSVGLEAHPLMVRIARTKLLWDYDPKELDRVVREFLTDLSSSSRFHRGEELPSLPGLLRRCYSPSNLHRLWTLRRRIRDRVPEPFQPLFELAFLSNLRLCSAAATGWPYIAPRRKIRERDAIATFSHLLSQFVEDLASIPPSLRTFPASVVQGDARRCPFQAARFEFVFTSPPYLNNYDYADRTRLESYFWGDASTWQELTETVRRRLLTSATTQVSRQDFDPSHPIAPEVEAANFWVAQELTRAVGLLTRRRRAHGGRKSYDVMVSEYFRDMTLALKEIRRTLRSGGRAILILGDSAPYGVHIPTDDYLGRLACGVGFDRYEIWDIRGRGEKWRANPQRHRVALRESFLVLDT